MRDSTHRDLAVFDFKDDEATAGMSTERSQSRLRPKLEDSVKKCHFLQAFAPGLTLKHDVDGVLCINMHEGCNSSSPYIIDAPEQGLNEKEQSDEIMSSTRTYDEHGQMCQDEFEEGALKRNNSSDGMEVDVISEDEENSSTMMGSQSSPSYTAELDDCTPAIGNALHNQISVMVFPDFVIYDGILYGESQLVFSSDCVKIECSDASGGDEKFTSEWIISDLVRVDSRWSGSVTTAFVKLCLRSDDATRREKHHTDSDVLKVMFSINDMCWLEKEQNIRNLAARYKDIWNDNSGDMMWENDSVDNDAFFSRDNFTEITNSFEDVVYPKGDPDAVSISKRDVDLLQPETFINDTIIDFYIKYLKNKIQPGQKHRFHFFNSFFFRKLADLDKDWGSVSEGRAAFLRVRKWTRKVNIFEKDYIFIPVNFNLHWSLLVICHPGEIANSDDNDIDGVKVPCILHMDSIKGSHSGVKNIIQSYVWEEWKERHPEAAEDDSSKFLNLRFVSLELPQQENSFDCGLFLLHYVELFLEEAPWNFDPFKITRLSSFLSADWFPPSEASLKRILIRKLIYELLSDSLQKVNPSTCSDGHPTTSGFPENNIEPEEHVEFLSARCSPAKDAMGARSADSEDGVELLTTSSAAHCDKLEELMLPDFLEAAPNTMPLPENGEHVHHHNATSSELLFASSPTVVCVDEREHMSSLSLEKEDCRPLEGNLDTHFCTTSSLNDVEAFGEPWTTTDEKDAKSDPTPECDNGNSANDNNRGECEETRASPGNVDYVPETPPSSSREKLDDIVDVSQDVATTKAESTRCEDSPRTHTVEDDCQIVDGKETKTKANACKVNDVCEITKAAKTEDGDDDCHEFTAESVHCEDHQATSSRSVRHDNASHVISRTCKDVELNGSSCCNHQENMPPPFEGIIITDEDDRSSDKDDVQEIGKRVVPQQPHKRRKVTAPEGSRRLTRSFTRESHSDT